MKKMTLLLALAGITTGTMASDPVIVEKFDIQISIECRDGRVAAVHPSTLYVPLDVKGRAFDRPPSLVDPFSAQWMIHNTCQSNGIDGVSFDVRDVSEHGFVVAGENISPPDHGPGFESKSQDGEVTVPLIPQDGVLHVRVTAESKQTAPDLASALTLINSAVSGSN
ncbi:hypothetical protein [Paraburkholderia nodosa]|uniref:hypothetical protein n=1 Tax=Paraburkholderia nodosa TaxID=392320 RepID=UPI0004818F33|nr:hypothetical protein [Paraburkholderia nodosa]